MDGNLYAMECDARQRLAEARATSARYRLIPRHRDSGGPRPALARRVRALYARWSSAASAGSKPTTARA